MVVKITYIGHSTVLIISGETAVLTDPVFSDNLLYTRRLHDLPYDPAALPKLDAILISHTHLDHLDYPSLNYIDLHTPFVVPEGSGKSIMNYLPNPSIELAAWAGHKFNDSLKVTATPAKHPRSIIPYYYKNAFGYIIEIGGRTIFFAGDSAYSNAFKDIGSSHSIDVALLPISHYKPAFLMKRWHMDPVEALQAFIDLRADIMIPIHWGTFRLTFERPEEPIDWLKKGSAERNLSERVKILRQGDSYDF